MGREIRRVPPNWQHPVYTAEDAPSSHLVGNYKGLIGGFIADELAEWLADFDRVRQGKDLTDFERKWYPQGLLQWLTDHAAPDPANYVPYTEAEATWFQVYETVSEGTPVSPPFATKDELVDYLCAYGDFWDQKRGDAPWSRSAAERFIKNEFAPSMIVHSDAAGVHIETPGHDPVLHGRPA